MLINALWVGLGAIFGACSRWGLGMWLNPLMPSYYFGTLVANLLGCFIIGLILPLSSDLFHIPDSIRLLIVTGFLGSLTTYSTFSAETISLFLGKDIWYGILHILLNLGGGLLMTFLGVVTIKLILVSK